MLNFILGRNNTARERAAVDAAVKASENADVILLVPEQFTAQIEREIANRCKNTQLAKIEVCNFSRLEIIVSNKTGVRRPKALSDGARFILMSKALDAVRDRLEIYSSVKSKDFIIRLTDLYDELTMWGIDFENDREKLENIANTDTAKKIKELFMIMSCYNAVKENSFTDTSSELIRLKQQLLDNFDGFKNTVFVLSEFDFLTPQEIEVAGALMKCCKDMRVALCCDTLKDTEGGYGLLSEVKAFALKLKAQAKKYSIPVGEDVILKEDEKISREILELEKNIFTTKSSDMNISDIQLYAAKDMYDEAEFIACKVKELVREQNYRYRDFLVIGRNIEDYKGILDIKFKKHNIPCFDDRRSELLSKPLVILIISIINTALYGFETDRLLSILKSGLLDIDYEDICLLQGYVYVWNINYGKWIQDGNWIYNPDGFVAEITEEGKEELEKVNKIRFALINPLKEFCNAVKKEKSSLNIAKALYEILCKYNVPQRLYEQTKEFNEGEMFELAQEQEQLWSLFVELLEQLIDVSKDDEIDLERFKEYLELSFSGTTIGKIPTSLDEIAIANVNRVRAYEPKVVFVLGANDGVFPKDFSDDGILSDIDRKRLSECGYELTRTTEDYTYEERFLCYRALTYAREKLFVSYFKVSLDGKEAMPSYMISAIENAFPSLKIKDFSSIETSERIQSVAPAFDILALSKEKIPELEEYFANNPEYADRYFQMKNINSFGNDEFLKEKKNIEKLFGKNIRMSASKIESYSECAYKYFCKYGLCAKKKQRAQLNAPQIGTFVHNALEIAVSTAAKEGGIEKLSDEQIKKLCAKICKDYLTEKIGTENNARFKYIYRKVSETLTALIISLRDEFIQSQFKPVDFELPINEKSQIKPITIELDGGGSIMLTGIVDRVDIYEKDGVKYIRVVDYKTGKKVFNLSDIVNGLNLQMLLYLFSIWQNGGEKYNSELLPAGILYYPARRNIIEVKREITEQELDKKRTKEQCTNGLLLSDAEILRAMENDLNKRYIPVKEGDLQKSSSSLATLEEFSKLKQKIEHQLYKIGSQITKGDIQINPIKGTKEQDACKYCEMKAICGYDSKRNRAKAYIKKTKDEILGEEEVTDEQGMDS
ncbi:MAG: hypothetical protein E7480_01810 [Ruminococcaceae bacterium]|nr:hypothetical protein [Oscillospiraceae bacterium]